MALLSVLSAFSRPEVRTSHNQRPKTLFTVVLAFYAVLIVAHSVLVIEKIAVFLFFLVA